MEGILFQPPTFICYVRFSIGCFVQHGVAHRNTILYHEPLSKQVPAQRGASGFLSLEALLHFP